VTEGDYTTRVASSQHENATSVKLKNFAHRLKLVFPGQSVAEIARKLGVPHPTVSNYFKHNRVPATEILTKIADETDVSLTWLLTDKGPQWVISTDESEAGGKTEDLKEDGISHSRLPEATKPPSLDSKGSEERVLAAHMQLIIEQNNLIIDLLQKIAAGLKL
jgi:transcriptional regulator with XRE-family HTH domain